MIGSLLLVVVKMQEKLEQAPKCVCDHDNAADAADGQSFTRVDSPSIKKELKELKSKLREVEDTTDFNWQRNIKGNLILNFIKKEESPILSDLGATAYKEKILNILDLRFGVSVPITDIQAMHPLKSGKNHIIRFGNRCPGSAFERLVTAIKTGKKYEEKREVQQADKVQPEQSKSNETPPQVFLTFQFTKKRLALINELRDMKRNKAIAKFTSDENGIISVIIKPGSRKLCLTYDYKAQNSKTFTVSELKATVEKGE